MARFLGKTGDFGKKKITGFSPGGKSPAARVMEVTRLKNGRMKRREIDPEKDRREAARKSGTQF